MRVKRSETAAQKKERLLAAAVALAVEDGLSALTHRRLASVGGVPLATVTYHFPSKAQLLIAMAEKNRVDAARTFAGDGEGGGTNRAALAGFLEAFARQAGSSLRRHLQLNLELALAAARDPSLAPFAETARRAEIESMQALLAEAGVTADESVALTMLAALSGRCAAAILEPAPSDGASDWQGG
jgi:AcrR family transcriptional regulator